ncbi:acetoacetate--CoA ligase [Desulfofundulus thermosubterraneus]|uniref:Acetoacetyl-CoA synthetase n=1 Tax=Desulfofundulus thermosubterraneus DSM 16057 TaxID=1121432 RepID=A0A1M6CVI3_9FIRM|nr:acetoacetate--CoA ligase [Desulfofundulus thermosubterraneus]SHI65027.1 acetoacetyl-CoA synthetase [Desulfofundulus thermosubterraneus DSM 16057]
MRKLLWEPPEERKKQANMTRFMEFVNKKHGRNFTTYNELYQWSIENAPAFWEAMWEFGGIIASRPYDRVVENFEDMLGSRWFVGAELNFAENLLRYRDEHTALIFKGEAMEEPVRLTYAGLYDQVTRLAKSLREMGVTVGDRVAGFMPNMIETVVAMLATTSIGAIWSSCSPDFGVKGVYDRFGQIQPRVLFCANGYSYNGKTYDSLDRVTGIVKEIPSIERVVVVPYTEREPDISRVPKAVPYQDFLAAGEGFEIEFNRLPFDHPVYIMYSSGTTGVPKCIVHGAGGTLIQHLKELILHTDLKREDTIFYFTTCGWMMWNWLVSSLAVGATVLLFDGSPFYPEAGALWKLAQDEGITIFGTSAKYLASLEKAGVKPGKSYNLSKLKAILSTGSPLPVESFEYVYRDIKQDVCLSSISGGTDIISCFALGNPTGPVYAGELQCRGLGMKVESYDSDGKPLINRKGELVCTAPFPSMPVYFWNDPDKKKYRSTYFDVYPNVWRHGDYVEITATGGVIIYGRSDATLNPGGVRIGTAEIYRVVESLPEVLDSIVVGQNWDNDVRVILFVKLAKGVELTGQLINKIKTAIRDNTTPRHVPAKIIAVKDIPYTLNGKKVEMAVRNVIHNQPVLNKDALANPEALEYFKNLPELQS